MAEMKIKQQREDFCVREISKIPTTGGPHAIYLLQKSGIGTAEALNRVAQCWAISRRGMRFGGRKDRHAITEQKISIMHGPNQDLDEENFSLRYIGQAPQAMTAKQIEGNEFTIQVRSLNSKRAKRMMDLAESPDLCLPNYFGQQRFGSVGISGEMVGQAWCRGDYERAVYLALAEENKQDPPQERKQKEILRRHWGDWQECKNLLDRSNRRSVITYLVDHPSGFKKAAGLIDRDMRSLYVSALQARIWNEVTAQKLIASSKSYRAIAVPACKSELVFPVELKDKAFSDLRRLKIPLPSSRPTQWSKDIAELVDEVSGHYGLKRHQLRFSYPRDVFFSRSSRLVLMHVQRLQASVASDELASSDHRKLQLQFQLPPGQYATSLLQGLELLTGEEAE